jgi:protein-disulfide isomerase
MGKRAEFKEKRKRQQQLQNFILIAMIVLAAIAITMILIWPTLQPEKDVVVPEYIKYPTDLVPSGEPGMGDPDAPVKLEVFADFQCPACANFALNIEPHVISDYVETGKVYLVFHPYSFLDRGTTQLESHRAAEAAFCALDQDAFWQFHDILFSNQTGENIGDFTKDRLLLFAEKINLDSGKFKDCLNDSKYEQRVLDEVEYGKLKEIDQTPSFYVNDKKIVLVSSFDELFQALDNAIKLKSK